MALKVFWSFLYVIMRSSLYGWRFFRLPGLVKGGEMLEKPLNKPPDRTGEADDDSHTQFFEHSYQVGLFKVAGNLSPVSSLDPSEVI